MVKYKPLACKLIVKIIKDQKIGSIILVEASKEHMAKEEGIILDIGAMSFEEDENAPKIGDTVVFARYAGKSLGVDEQGNDLRVMLDKDIHAIKLEE